MKKTLNFLLVCTVMVSASSSLWAVEHNLGVRADGFIMQGYGGVGTYAFTGEFRNPTNNTAVGVTAVRSVNQSIRFGGGVGLFYEAGLTPWFSLIPELNFSFGNGITYTGNYNPEFIMNPPDFVPLTGTMKYNYTSLDLNLLMQFTLVRPKQHIAVNFMIGPAASIILGSVTETFHPDFMVVNAPANETFTNKLTPANRFTMGITTGVGAQIDMGPGKFGFDVRTTWYFRPLFETYLSAALVNPLIRFAKPLSLGVSYSFALGKGY